MYFVVQGVDLRQYSKQIESDLRNVENESIHDCIHSLSPNCCDFFVLKKVTVYNIITKKDVIS